MEGSEAEIYRGPGRGDVRYRWGDIFGFTVPCGCCVPSFSCVREGERRGKGRQACWAAGRWCRPCPCSFFELDSDGSTRMIGAG
jgi:hypothetical protein